MNDMDDETVFMDDLKPAILSADATDLQDLLHLVSVLYAKLFPDWELHIVSIKKSNRIEELNSMISMLENLKREP